MSSLYTVAVESLGKLEEMRVQIMEALRAKLQQQQAESGEHWLQSLRSNPGSAVVRVLPVVGGLAALSNPIRAFNVLVFAWGVVRVFCRPTVFLLALVLWRDAHHYGFWTQRLESGGRLPRSFQEYLLLPMLDVTRRARLLAVKLLHRMGYVRFDSPEALEAQQQRVLPGAPTAAYLSLLPPAPQNNGTGAGSSAASAPTVSGAASSAAQQQPPPQFASPARPKHPISAPPVPLRPPQSHLLIGQPPAGAGSVSVGVGVPVGAGAAILASPLSSSSAGLRGSGLLLPGGGGGFGTGSMTGSFTGSDSAAASDRPASTAAERLARIKSQKQQQQAQQQQFSMPPVQQLQHQRVASPPSQSQGSPAGSRRSSFSGPAQISPPPSAAAAAAAAYSSPPPAAVHSAGSAAAAVASPPPASSALSIVAAAPVSMFSRLRAALGGGGGSNAPSPAASPSAASAAAAAVSSPPQVGAGRSSYASPLATSQQQQHRSGQLSGGGSATGGSSSRSASRDLEQFADALVRDARASFGGVAASAAGGSSPSHVDVPSWQSLASPPRPAPASAASPSLAYPGYSQLSLSGSGGGGAGGGPAAGAAAASPAASRASTGSASAPASTIAPESPDGFVTVRRSSQWR